MLRSHLRKPRVLLACILLAGATTVLSRAAIASALPPLPDFCATQAPDATATIPFTVSSGDSSYSTHLCPRYIVNATLPATLSGDEVALGARSDPIQTNTIAPRSR
jgi:hypothetical protein